MKKAEQRAINRTVEYQLARFNGTTEPYELKEIGQLYTCKATVYQTWTFIVLRSYNTIVAIIDKKDMTLYDFSRYVYGYTATTAQHISKFAKFYNIGHENIYTWKEVR